MSIEEYKAQALLVVKEATLQNPTALNRYRKLQDIFVQDAAIVDEGEYYANTIKQKAKLLFQLQGLFL